MLKEAIDNYINMHMDGEHKFTYQLRKECFQPNDGFLLE
jgi:hypothetical protein